MPAPHSLPRRRYRRDGAALVRIAIHLAGALSLGCNGGESGRDATSASTGTGTTVGSTSHGDTGSTGIASGSGSSAGSTAGTAGTATGTASGTGATDTAGTTAGGLCGNALLDAGEACDDGNALDGDGCSATCTIECGYLCPQVGEPCLVGFHGVQCDSPGPPFGQPSPIANTCRVATLSVDGSLLALSPATTMGGQPRHLDAMFTNADNLLLGFAGDTEDVAAGSRLVLVDPTTGVMTPVGDPLGLWVMGAAMNDDGELWTTVFDTYESNATTEVRTARLDPATGAILDGPTTLTMGNQPVTVWSTHVSDVAFRFDGAMFVSANEPGPPPPEPLSQYFEVDPTTATVLSAVDGPDDLYAAGLVFVGENDKILAMDIRGADDVYLLDLAQPPGLDAMVLYPDPIPTNSGTADLAGCVKLPLPQ